MTASEDAPFSKARIETLCDRAMYLARAFIVPGQAMIVLAITQAAIAATARRRSARPVLS